MHQATIDNACLFASAWVEKRNDHGGEITPEEVSVLVNDAIVAAEYEERLARDSGQEPWVNHEAMCQKGQDWYLID